MHAHSAPVFLLRLFICLARDRHAYFLSAKIRIFYGWEAVILSEKTATIVCGGRFSFVTGQYMWFFLCLEDKPIRSICSRSEFHPVSFPPANLHLFPVCIC